MAQMMKQPIFSFLCALCFLRFDPGAHAVEPLDEIVIVANSNVQDSVALARFYAEKRGIAPERICLLDLPQNETIGRIYYEEKLRDPFLDFLRRGKFIQQVKRDKAGVKEHDSGWKTVKSDVKYVALMYGVPLRIEDTRGSLARKAAQALNAPMTRDDAAVDTELALALADGFEIEGRSPNFFYDQIRWDDLGASPGLMLVTRLDGPDAKTVRRMIEDSIFAEAHGLWGRAYFDTRGLKNTSYLIGDFWLREAAARFDREGWPVTMDAADPVWGEAFPMEDCAVYMGWYAENCVGPFTRTNFAFARGAFAYHNHSANAKTLRTETNFWCGPLLAKGACCTMGATAEPYLFFTPNMQIFSDRFVSGATFAEAAYMSLPALSWQIAVIGDPLYRPFGRSLDDLGAALEKGGDADAQWPWLIAANRLVAQGRLNVAMDLLRAELKKKNSTVLRERLADLYLVNNLLAEADREFKTVIADAKTPETAYRAAQKEVAMFRSIRRFDDAEKITKEVREKWPDEKYRRLLEAVP